MNTASITDAPSVRFPFAGTSGASITRIRDKELASQFDPSVYYESFLTLILEEARASLQAGIEAIENKKIKPLALFFHKPFFCSSLAF